MAAAEQVMVGAGRRRVLGAALRLVAATLAVAGFFSPWLEGSGALTGLRFTGYELAGYTDALHALELPAMTGSALLTARVAIILVAVAGIWQLLLAAGHGSTVIAAATATFAAQWWLTGPALPFAGPVLLTLASVLALWSMRLSPRAPFGGQ